MKCAANMRACKSSCCQTPGRAAQHPCRRGEAAVIQGRGGPYRNSGGSRGWIPGTPNSIWPSLPVSFLGKWMGSRLCEAWKGPGLCADSWGNRMQASQEDATPPATRGQGEAWGKIPDTACPG